MRTLIAFYSRTGSTKKAVEALAAMIGADLAEIRCPRYRPGAASYVQAAFDSLRGRMPPIEPLTVKTADYDLMVIGTPIWTGHPALPIRAFLAQQAKLPGRVALLVTRGGASPDRTYADIQAALAQPIVARLALTTSDINRGMATEAIRGFADELMDKRAIRRPAGSRKK